MGGVGWSPEAEWGLQIGWEVGGGGGVDGEFLVEKRLLSGDAIRVGRRKIEDEGAVVNLRMEAGKDGCALGLERR